MQVRRRGDNDRVELSPVAERGETRKDDGSLCRSKAKRFRGGGVRIEQRRDARPPVGGHALAMQPTDASATDQREPQLIPRSGCLFVHGFSPRSHRQTICPQPGQPRPYLSRTACSRSMPATLAIVTSHASTSANSAASSSFEPDRSAPASSPTSSISHMNVPSTPRAASLSEYISAISV